MDHFVRSIFRSRLKLILTFVLLGFAIYACVLQSPFKVLDDYASIIDNKAIRSLANIPTIFTAPFFKEKVYYRPLVTFSFMLEYHFFKLQSFFYNVDNLLLHIGTSLLVFYVGRALLQEVRLAFGLGLLFLVHPIHWEQICNVPGRAILLCAFFFMLSFYTFIRMCGEEKKRKFWLSISWISFLLALLSKESAVVLPLVMTSYVFFFQRTKHFDFKFAPHVLFLFWITLALYFFLRKILGMHNGAHWFSAWEMFFGVVTFLKSLLVTLKNFVIPNEFYYDNSARLFSTSRDPMVWATLLIWSTGLYALFIFRRRITPLFWFLLSWIAFNLITVSQIIPIKVSTNYISTAEHFYYLPAFGIMAFMVLGFSRLKSLLLRRQWMSEKTIRILKIGFYMWLIFTTVEQCLYASQPLSMFKRSLEFNPENNRVRIAVGLTLAENGLYKEAEGEFRRVLANEPWDGRARISLGKTLCDLGRCWEGIQEYEKVIDPGDSADILKENLRLSYAMVIRDYKKRLETDDKNARLHYSLGVMYGKTNQNDEALAEFEKALTLDSQLREAILNAGTICALKGQYDKALGYYQQLIVEGVSPDDNTLAAYGYLQKVFLAKGDSASAQAMQAKFEEVKKMLKK